MNSFVSVEEQDLPCEEYENLIFSTSNISVCNLVSEKKGVDFENSANKNSENCSHSATLIPDDYLVCMSDGEKLDHNFGSATRSESDSEPDVSIDPKSIPVNVDENYDNINAVDIEYLPFETVLMNYPGQVDYLDLDEKFLNISFRNSPNPFESDSEEESFHGFSDSDNSFEGFNEVRVKPKYLKNKSHPGPKSKSKLKAGSHSEESKQRHRSRSTETDTKQRLNIKKQIRHSIDSNYLKGCGEELTQINKSLIKEVTKNKNHLFGEYKGTPFSNRFKASDIKGRKLDLVSESTLFKPSPNRTRVAVSDKSETSKSFQNYSEGVASSFYTSGTSKFKEKANESTGAMQQKGKKEILTSSNKDFNLDHLFSETSDNESFEGFPSGIELKEDENDEEFIGINCNNIGCTISWLESKQAKCIPQYLNNGIVFELSEFAKKIAWEPVFVAEWLYRLRGQIDVKPTDEDMRKINSVLKRRKAINVNFAGKHALKTKLSTFDLELFSLLNIENKQGESKDPKPSSINQKPIKRKSNILKDKSLNNIESLSFNKIKESISNSTTNEKEISVNISSTSDNGIRNDRISEEENSDISDSDNEIKNLSLEDNYDLSDSDMIDLSDTEQSIEKDVNVSLNAPLHMPSNESRISGRIRKPTTKAQESYSRKYMSSTPQSNDFNEYKSSLGETLVEKSKLLTHIFIDDGKDIGPNCRANSINISVLNSANEISYPITKGVVYELYHFFRERKASLTSLVHMLYRLKKIPFDKSHIIATMAKIHEMVKVMWEENINKNPDMPIEEFDLLVAESSENKKSNKRGRSSISNYSEVNSKSTEPLHKKSKISHIRESVSKGSSEKSESDSSSEYSSIEPSKETSLSNGSFDLNSTKGYFGKITRGDIVYLYTKWLKKKMEGSSTVFVTDLSKDVLELINDRKVECFRIPVGTLMSSSVKLFDEFRKLSKENMLQAKKYLLEDYIEDIKAKLNATIKKKSENKQDNEKSSNQSTSNKIKNTNEREKSKETIPKESSDSPSKRSIPGVPNEYEVEKIVGYRIVKVDGGDESVTEYRIRWLGFSSKFDSWINESDLTCQDTLTRFWEALRKQRALKEKSESGPCSQSAGALREAKDKTIPTTTQSIMNKSPIKQLTPNIPPTVQSISLIKENKDQKKFIPGQENVSPFFGSENGSQNFFNIMINNLKSDLVDYHHEEDTSFIKRIKITKGDILQIYDEWRFENQEHLLTGGNQKVDVNVLIGRVKDLMESKKVRNFNPSCLIDACYRLALMRAKLKEASKKKEYLAGDFMEFIQSSQKHQDFVRNEYSSKIKKLKQNKAHVMREYDQINEKINTISNMERESLIIAKYLNTNKNATRMEKELESKVCAMKKTLQVELKDYSAIENIKKQNSQIIKELEAHGIPDNTMEELLNIALKIKL